MPSLFRKPGKPSTSTFGIAIALSVGLTIQFVLRVARDVYVRSHNPNLLTLSLYLLIWNLLPLTIFTIGKLLQKQGR